MIKAKLVHLIFVSPVMDTAGKEFDKAEFHDVCYEETEFGMQVSFPNDPTARYTYPWHRLARVKVVRY